MKGRKTMNWKKKLLALGLSLALTLSLTACGQKAASEACTFVSVSLRPIPPPLAVTQRIELISPGFRSFSAASFVGFSNTISCALLFFRIGLSAAGRLS